MKLKFAIFTLALMVTSFAHAAVVLPDSCGSDKVKFDVEMKKDQPTPPSPGEGKALIVFIEVMNKPGTFKSGVHVSDVTMRFGMDGVWVGAAKGGSYFVLQVAPGEHHLCTSAQPSLTTPKNMLSMAKFTAEAGKTYYYEFKIDTSVTHVMVNNGSEMASGSGATLNFDFAQVDEDEGKFRVKASAVSASTPK